MAFVSLLWLPIVLSAVVVFVLSAASHMVLPWRRNEWGRITEFGPLQGAVRGLAPGLYAFPAAPDQRQQLSKEWMARWAQGPSGWLTLAAPGPISMGRNMALSLLVFLAVATVDAYLAFHALGYAPHRRAVLRLVSAVSFMAFALGPIFNSIWYSRPWRAYLSDVVDAILFSAATGGIFALLWPEPP
jgi:hypothetical protein